MAANLRNKNISSKKYLRNLTFHLFLPSPRHIVVSKLRRSFSQKASEHFWTLTLKKGIIFPFHAQDVKIDSLHAM